MSKILILSNHDSGLYLFRKELLIELLVNNEIIVSIPKGDFTDALISLGCDVVFTDVDRRGINPFKDLKLLLKYIKIIKKYNPNVILTYTIKPNIYGGIASRVSKKPYIANITGLGTAFENKGIISFVTLKLYRFALKKANVVFFQNKENLDFMRKRNITGKSSLLLPGSGVNIKHFEYLPYPKGDKLNFLYVGRVMKAKGIELFLEAAKTMKMRYPHTEFHIIGDYEDDYKTILEEYQLNKYIVYHGKVDDVRKFYEFAHAVIHPSFHEGMSNTLLEAAASGRPIIASNIAGCKETFDENLTGFGFKVKNQESLIDVMGKFMKLSHQEKEKMGRLGRDKIINEFNRNIVTEQYKKEILNISEGNK